MLNKITSFFTKKNVDKVTEVKIPEEQKKTDKDVSEALTGENTIDESLIDEETSKVDTSSRSLGQVIKDVASGNSKTGAVTTDLIADKFGENGNVITDWLTDKDKVCTDGNDDGKISFKEKAASFGKGLAGIVKTVVKHPIATGLTIGAGVAITILTGGAALPIMVGIGIVAGSATIGIGAYKASKAETDGDAKTAYEQIGNGVFTLAASVASAKPALQQAQAAGVEGIEVSNNPVKNVAQVFKSIPNAAKTSVQNIHGNIATWTTGVVHDNSNQMRALKAQYGEVKYMSKANEVQAYRFNPNGTDAEIMANNPGVFKNADGQWCIPNKWNPEAPFVIDTTKEQMIMMYDGMNDMAVCDGAVFKGSYVDTTAFKADGTLNYQDPSSLQYGQIINATKQAPGSFVQAPAGTTVQTLEGPVTLKEGQVIAFDHDGNPYVQTLANILKRNIPADDPASKLAFENILSNQ